MRLRQTSLTVALLGVAFGPLAASAHEHEPTVVNVPGDVHSIQEAIDLVADRGTVQIAEGTYPEVVTIMGKQVDLVGTGNSPGRVTISGPIPQQAVDLSVARGLVTYGPGGSGRIANLTLIGSDAAVLARSPEPDTTMSVNIDDVVIHQAGYGVAVQNIGDVTFTDSSIISTINNAIQAQCLELLHMANTHVANGEGSGLVKLGCGIAAGEHVTIEGSQFSGNKFGGAIFVGPMEIEITGSYFNGNRYVGLMFIDTQSVVSVSDSFASANFFPSYEPGEAPEPLEYFDTGDGIYAQGVGTLHINNTETLFNERAGIVLDQSIYAVFSEVLSEHNAYGLVVQNGATYELSGITATTNTKKNILVDGTLPAPAPLYAPPISE